MNTSGTPAFLASRSFRAIAVLVGVWLAVAPAQAKRLAPKPVAAVVADQVEYSAPPAQMGIVVATDLRTHQELWHERIYTVKKDPALEGDVQDIYITSLAVEKGTLIVTNERGQKYRLDLATRKVTKQGGR